MDLDQINAFLAIARRGSISQAARDLYRTQPAISLKIRALENELGERLLERRPRGVVLTAAGEVFRRRAEAIGAEIQALSTEIVDLSARRAGRVSLGASDTVCLYLLPRVLERFVRKYPGIELRLHTQISRRVIELIRSDQVDFGIVTLPAEAEGIRWRKLYDDRFVVVLPHGHRLAGRRWIRPEELAGDPIIHLKPDTLTRAWIDHKLEPHGLQGRVRMEVSTIEVIKRLVEVGLGVSLLPEMAIGEELRSGRLRGARLRGVPLERPVGLVYRKGKYFSHALEAFLDEIETETRRINRRSPGRTARSRRPPR
jgi:DNA-binding transcriptional LysR family regulator